jgi:hypothetical protein
MSSPDARYPATRVSVPSFNAKAEVYDGDGDLMRSPDGETSIDATLLPTPEGLDIVIKDPNDGTSLRISAKLDAGSQKQLGAAIYNNGRRSLPR